MVKTPRTTKADLKTSTAPVQVAAPDVAAAIDVATIPEAKASEDNGATVQDSEVPADSVTGDASRASDGAGSVTSIPPETATEQRENVPSQDEVRPGSTSLGTEQQSDTFGVAPGETGPYFEDWKALEVMDERAAFIQFPYLIAALAGWVETATVEQLEAGPNIVVQAKVSGFRRAGMKHGIMPVEYRVQLLSPQQVEALLAEPELATHLVTPTAPESAPS